MSYELVYKLLRTRTSRELKYRTPEEKRVYEIPEILAKFLSGLHARVAHLMRTAEKIVKEKELKKSLLDIENYIFDAAQNTMHVKNITLLDILEIFRTFMEKIEYLMKLLPSQDTDMNVFLFIFYFEEISNMFLSMFNQTKETAKVQQISEIELD